MPSPLMTLSGKPHFRRVYATGRRCTRDGVTAIASPREGLGPARLGLSVSRATGPAVVRNRIRRRLRAACRSFGPVGADVILVGRADAHTAPYHLLEEYVKEALQGAGVRGAGS